MPGVTLHLHLAERTLRHWSRQRAAPFPLGDQRAVDAFRQGAFGPDLGYFPGGPRALSDLAHAHRTADLCRTLVRLARTPVERAFAWGWVGHVLADLAVHPLLGCAVGELVHGTAARFVDGDRNPAAHGRVEAGLDAVYAARHPELRGGPSAAAFDEGSIGYLARAYGDTHGIELDPSALLRAHRAAMRRAAQGLALAALTARVVAARPTLRTGQGEGRLRRRIAASSLALAYLLPVTPPLWLLAAVRSVARAFPRTLTEACRSGAAQLENRNLDTGCLEHEVARHGAAARAAEFLRGTRPWA
jgi:hypothetical protein